MKDEDITEVLTEDLDEEVLKRMPLWFRRLREAYIRNVVPKRLALDEKIEIKQNRIDYS